MSEDILSVECPYTACCAKVGEVCTNARTGKPMSHGHKDRKRELRDREQRLANSGHRVEMSYNAWQIVRLVACSMLHISIRDGVDDATNLVVLLHELPALNFHSKTPPRGRRGRQFAVFPKKHRQRFSGSILATLKKVMREASTLRGGAFEGPCCVIHGQAEKIPDGAIDQLGSLAG